MSSFTIRVTSRSRWCRRFTIVNLRHHLLRDVTRIVKLDIRTRTRSYFSVRQHQPEDTDLDASKLANHERRYVSKRLPRLIVDHVCRNPAKLRLANSIAQHVGAKVELVIAKGGVVESDRIPRLNHLRAFVSDRFD